MFIADNVDIYVGEMKDKLLLVYECGQSEN